MRLSLLCFLCAVSFTAAQTYERCSTGDYYSTLGTDTSTWTKEALHDVLKSSHQGVLPFTNKEDPGVDDVWAALIDVDPGSQNGTVSLIYENEDLPDIPFGERSWVKEHLFPILRGVGIVGPAVSDVHNIRPVSSLANIVKGIKYYGECGVLVRPETCQQPAEGGAADTCSCNRLYTPPAAVRGDIARALMYMDVRYDGSEPLTYDLRLTDCPFQPERDMAYLSQMLTWHEEDPPSDEEIIRNNKVCEKWQGNRNPFVDHPELATQIFGNPLPLPSIGEALIYPQCKAIPTNAPTYAPNQCDMYEEGEFQIWLMNSVNPDTVGVYSVKPMPEAFELFMTDNAWNGNEFTDGEGTMSFVTPEGGLDGGAVFGYGADDMPFQEIWEPVQGTFSLSEAGEIIFLYCINAAGDQRPLLAFNYGGAWVPEGLDTYEENESALPTNLGLTSLVNLEHFNNYFYVGESDLPEEELKLAVSQQANWEGSDTRRYGITDAQASSSNRQKLMLTVPLVVLSMLAATFA